MKFLIVFVALFALAVARPNTEILKSDSDVQPDGYSWNLETSDGTSHHEEGHLKDDKSDHPAIVVHGSYSYKDEHDGHVYTVTYVADENGFQPSGAHIPKVPEVVHHDVHNQHNTHGHHN